VTDGQTDILPRHSTLYAYASRGKNVRHETVVPVGRPNKAIYVASLRSFSASPTLKLYDFLTVEDRGILSEAHYVAREKNFVKCSSWGSPI